MFKPIITTALILVATVLAAQDGDKEARLDKKFSWLDVDQSGDISLAELTNPPAKEARGDKDRAERHADFKAKMTEKMTAIFPTADADASGALSKEEFASIRRLLKAQAFTEIDANSDGLVTIEEMKAFKEAKRAAHPQADKQAKKSGDKKGERGQRAFAQADANGDGQLDLEEFQSMKHPRRGHGKRDCETEKPGNNG